MNYFSVGLYTGSVVLALGGCGLIYLTLRNLSSRSVAAGAQTTAFDVDNSGSYRRRLIELLTTTGELSPTHLSGLKLTSTAASLGFANLELIARQIMENSSEPPYLYGVNRGGSLLANLLSQRLGLSQKHLVRCDYRRDWDRVICEPRPGVRRIIVIDDVVRTGDTIRRVKEYLLQLNPNAVIHSIALVVVAPDENEGSAREVIDYAAWISPFRGIGLPWSNSEEEDPRDYFDEEGMEQIVGRLLEHSKKVANG